MKTWFTEGMRITDITGGPELASGEAAREWSVEETEA